MKTSLTDPLRIATLSPPDMPGRIGPTLCPGKKDRGGGWDRDLDIDLVAIHDWGAEIVVTLVERHELDLLDVALLPEAVARHEMRWVPSADPGRIGSGRPVRGTVPEKPVPNCGECSGVAARS